LTSPSEDRREKLNIVLSMLYAKICPKVRSIMPSQKGSALCLLTVGHILAYNMDNTILLLLIF
jgi:hypothetical protein